MLICCSYINSISHSKRPLPLVEGQSILPSFDQKLRDFVERKIGQRKNFKLLKDFVVEVGDGYVKLKSGDVIQTGLVVWSTGLAPRPFTGMPFFRNG